MKKIALAIENFSKYGGGAESYAVDLAETLVGDGWEVHCYGETWGGEPEAAFFHQIKIAKFLPIWLKMLLFSLKHKKMVQNGRFDVVLGFGNTIHMNVYQSHGGVHWYSTMRKSYTESNKILRFLKKLLIVLSPKHHVRNWIEASPFRKRKTLAVIAISEMIRCDMADYYKIDKKTIELVYNGIDTIKFDRESIKKFRKTKRAILGVSDDEVVFLFVSYELKKKGIEPLIKAAGMLKEQVSSRFKVIIVGGPTYKGVEKLIMKFDLRGVVTFTGPCKSIHEMYAAADAFILPTYYDACSLVVLEAMACGLPPITTETNGIAGILTDGQNGYVLSHPPNAEKIFQKMKLLMNEEVRHKMAEESLRHGLKFTKKKNHQAMLKILNKQAKS